MILGIAVAMIVLSVWRLVCSSLHCYGHPGWDIPRATTNTARQRATMINVSGNPVGYSGSFSISVSVAGDALISSLDATSIDFFPSSGTGGALISAAIVGVGKGFVGSAAEERSYVTRVFEKAELR